ncbi:hypothetical protein [uncultured Corynebacterium sp.]|uniref:hypothetical protein n=1 Tax=uncultured Corynebacterium sp. TaxID=159447 RepID=UPI0025F9ACCF|nr:hypothetical protein [uncultured Corynebacterium sp.]
MHLHVMQQVKRLFAWTDAYEETRNIDLHLLVAFRIVAEHGAAVTPKISLSDDELEDRETPVAVVFEMTPGFRAVKARLAKVIADALHCRFAWTGSLSGEEGTTAVFLGVEEHVDRARLLYELIEPDLRLITGKIGPIRGKGSGPGGAPSGDGLDFFIAQSNAMNDAVTWIGERLAQAELQATEASGLFFEFEDDAVIADDWALEMRGRGYTTVQLSDLAPDLPRDDWISDVALLELFDDDDADDDDADDDGEDEEEKDDEDLGEDLDDVDDVAGAGEESGLDLVLEIDVDEEWHPARTFMESCRVNFMSAVKDDEDPSLIRFGPDGWQLFYPVTGQWVGDPDAEKTALTSGLFFRVSRSIAELWVRELTATVLRGDDAPDCVMKEIDDCLADGFDVETAHQVVRMRWSNLPEELLTN